MGEYADDIIDQMIGEEGAWGYRPRRRPNKYQADTGDYMWRSKEGVISMHDMTTSHLENALKFCTNTCPNPDKAKQLREVLNQRAQEDNNPPDEIPF